MHSIVLWILDQVQNDGEGFGGILSNVTYMGCRD